MIKDRIKSLRRVKASKLLANPKNWRTHPKEQAAALSGVLGEVGIADALVARETPEGLELIDGHLRKDTAPDTKWPVLVLDVTEEEADKLLAIMDPLGAMATADADKLGSLLDGMIVDHDGMQSLLDNLAADHLPAPNGEVVEDEVPEAPKDPLTKPGD